MARKTKQLVRKALLLGMGAASFGADAVEEAIIKLKEMGELDDSEAREVAQEFANALAKARGEAQKHAAKGLSKAAAASPFATKAQLAALERRVEKLERKGRKR